MPLAQSRWYDRFGSSSDPTRNERLHYNDIDKSLNETVNDKIRKYREDYNNPPTVVVFIPVIPGTNGRLHSDFIRLLFLQTHRETDRFFSSFRNSVRSIKLGNYILPLSSCGVPESV
jgi:hypothetical protein